jgi:hypothetical protein
MFHPSAFGMLQYLKNILPGERFSPRKDNFLYPETNCFGKYFLDVLSVDIFFASGGFPDITNPARKITGMRNVKDQEPGKIKKLLFPVKTLFSCPKKFYNIACQITNLMEREIKIDTGLSARSLNIAFSDHFVSQKIAEAGNLTKIDQRRLPERKIPQA